MQITSQYSSQPLRIAVYAVLIYGVVYLYYSHNENVKYALYFAVSCHTVTTSGTAAPDTVQQAHGCTDSMICPCQLYAFGGCT